MKQTESAGATHHRAVSSEHMRHELNEILGWWTNWMVDHANGGFYGRREGNHILDSNAHKSVILNARILWAFSAAARQTGSELYTKMARRAYEYFIARFLDLEHGGVYWMLDAKGNVVDDKKQIYGQAFTVYALSEYHALTKEPQALDHAKQIFHLIENKSYDPLHDGYIDAFSRDWQSMEDLRLSEKDLNAAKTMNTHLHLLEAYTNLLRVDTHNTDASQALRRLIRLFLDKFIDQETFHLHMFFDREWSSLSSVVSFGHDIECSWLITEAAEVLGDEELIQLCNEIAVRMASVVLDEGLDEHGMLYNDRDEHGAIKPERHWWVQAEAMIGLWNAWQISGETRYAIASERAWQSIQTYFRDPIHGEWFWGIDKNLQPDRHEDKAGPWKAPYHNSRMCLEMIHRLRHD